MRQYDEQCEAALEKSKGSSVKLLNRDWLDSPWKGNHGNSPVIPTNIELCCVFRLFP